MVVLWPDGTRTRADSATACLELIAKVQWDQPMSIEGLKYVLAARAFGWNKTIIDPTLDDDTFLRALGETGMVFVSETDPSWD